MIHLQCHLGGVHIMIIMKEKDLEIVEDIMIRKEITGDITDMKNGGHIIIHITGTEVEVEVEIKDGIETRRDIIKEMNQKGDIIEVIVNDVKDVCLFEFVCDFFLKVKKEQRKEKTNSLFSFLSSSFYHCKDSRTNKKRHKERFVLKDNSY